MGIKMSRSGLGAVGLLIVAGVWGATLSFTKEALAVVGVNSFLALRFIVATLALVPFLSRKKSAPISAGNTLLAVLLGGVLYGIFFLQSLGLKTVTTAATGFITGTNVAMVPVITLVLFKKGVSRQVWLGIAVTIAGLGIVGGRGLFSPMSGYSAVLLAAFLIAVDIVAVERIMASIDAMWLAFVEIATMAVISTALSLTAGDGGVGGLKVLTSFPIILAVLFNGILGTSIALWAQNHFQTIVPSAQVAVIFSSEPIFAAVIAWMLFGGTVTLNVVAGGLLVLIGITIADEEAFEYLGNKFLSRERKSHR